MIKKTLKVFGLMQFWGWNILGAFLAILLVAYAILPYVIVASINGEIPLSITFCTLLLCAMPFIGIFWGIKHHKSALPFFYGVQIPVISLTLLRLFAVRELTFGTGLIIGLAILACASFGWHLWKAGKNPDDLSTKNSKLYVVTFLASLIAITGLYVGLNTLLYALPIGMDFFKGIFSSNWQWFKFIDLFFLVFILFFYFSVLCFLLFPFYIAFYYPKHWWEFLKSRWDNRTKVLTTSAISVVSLLGLFILATNQNWVAHFETLEKSSPAELRTQMENPKKVRKTLLNTYLHEYRFLGNTQRNGLQRHYRKSFGSDALGSFAQKTQNLMISPFLYRGGLSDSRRADTLYETLFDTPIQRVEQKAISKALQASYNRDEVTAGLMNIGLRNVLLREQNVTVEDLGTHARVEIEEIYENLTFENQEIFYYFSLPEDAAITGIWIGRTDDRAKMDKYIVAPRGAAQKVYEAQVVRNIDPALLEQVGPGQYRLRLFPIPVTNRTARVRSRSRVFSGRRKNFMRMHLQYVTPNIDGKFSLPKLLEKRNVNWSRKTKRRLNGEAIKTKNGWMGANYVKAKTAQPSTLTLHLDDYSVTKESFGPNDNIQALRGRYAVIIDSSYSMRDNVKVLNENLESLSKQASESQLAEFDYFVFRQDEGLVSIANPRDTALNPFGTITLQDMVVAYERQIDRHDGLIILTDQSRYGVTTGIGAFDLKLPLWVFSQKQAPAAFDDNILDLIYRNRGGVISSMDHLWASLASSEAGRWIMEGRSWSVTKTRVDDPELNSSTPEEAALAARQVILAESFGKAPTPQALDSLHAIAKTYDVITPYSSMIVLVNDRQRQQLEAASQSQDRFDRESRSGKEFLTTPAAPSAVPEPHEWILIIISLLLLVWLWRRRDDFGGFAQA